MHIQQRQNNTFTDSTAKRVSKILRHAKATVPYYREILDPGLFEGEVTDFSAFMKVPLLERSTVAACPDKFLSANIPKSTLVTQKTSGSSGSPLRLFKSPFEAAMLAKELLKLRNEWCGDFLQTPKTIFIGGPGYGSEPTPAVRSSDNLALNLNLVSLNEKACMQYLDMIARHRSQWMTSNTTIALTLAREAWKYPSIRRALNLKWVELLGQYVSPEDKEAITKSLGARVISHYGCWELYTMAYDRPCGHMHLLDDCVFLEVVEIGTGKPSHEGETIVTGLKHFTMPFMRYRLKDIVRLSSQKCSYLNTPTLEVLRGRVYNYIKGPDRYDGEHFFNFAFKELEDKGFPRLKQFQVRQTGESAFVILWVGASPPEPEMKETLCTMMRNRLGKDTHLKWQREKCIKPSSKGVVSAFVCEI